jgi:hypothetical protein
VRRRRFLGAAEVERFFLDLLRFLVLFLTDFRRRLPPPDTGMMYIRGGIFLSNLINN